MKFDFNGRDIFIDNILWDAIQRWKIDVLKKDKDKVILVDGREGSGKSVLAQQVASALDPNFNIDKIAFTGEDLMKKIRSIDPKQNRKKGDCFILDEAFGSINSRQAMSSINRAMIQLGTEMRHFNLFVIIVLPYFFDMDRYYAIARADTLLHVYFNKKGDRGNYIVFPYSKKKDLYIKGKKLYSYSPVKSPYPAMRFAKGYVVDYEEYEKRKTEATTNQLKTSSSRNERKWIERFREMVLYANKVLKIPYIKIGEQVGMTDANLKNFISLTKKDNVSPDKERRIQKIREIDDENEKDDPPAPISSGKR